MGEIISLQMEVNNVHTYKHTWVQFISVYELFCNLYAGKHLGGLGEEQSSGCLPLEIETYR